MQSNDLIVVNAQPARADMKSHVLAMLVACIAASMPLAAGANGSTAICRFENDEARQSTSRRGDAFSAALTALDRGDITAAQAHFDRALAEKPNTFLITFLGNFYKTGDCLPKDLRKAAAIYRIGADHGDGGSMLELALLYWNGQGVPEDREAAIQLFRQGLIAFELLGGQSDVPNLEGLVDGPVPPDLLSEFDWVKDLATTPRMGLAVADALRSKSPPDAVAACRYLALSFDRHPDAETAYRLGMMHLESGAITPSKFYGFLYLSRAATEDHPLATAEIGRRLIKGEIQPRTDWQGLAWLIRAKRLGQPVAMEIEAAKRGLPAASIREAEIHASILPPFVSPRPQGGEECVGTSQKN